MNNSTMKINPSSISFPSFAPSPETSPSKPEQPDIQRIYINLPEEYLESSDPDGAQSTHNTITTSS